ncbi:single-stranded-DNA-specific exonuclease RecJ [bacterium]|nr:single-stranded-DNA-specific exonuclease RecJ [bacterium]
MPSSSSKGNIWVFPQAFTVPEAIKELVSGDEVLASLLVQRGYDTEEKAREFLDPDTSYKPTSPMELPDVDKAVRRITEAIQKSQHITVYGDYDVDGVTGTSVLLSVLRELGADVDFYIPNRMSEGYGLNLKAVSILASKHKTKLIITCDCGVSNFAEINFAKSLGVDTLVLDHHTMPEIMPPAVGIVHPKLLDSEHPLYDLPGVGVAYKVCEALLADNGKAEKADDLIDLVTMGMIADLVPLVRENRYLVRIGLKKLIETKRVGLQALLGQVRQQKSTDLVGFGIAPRINAAGRLSDATKAVELMTTEDPVRAEEIADELQKENVRRQELCEKIFLEADARVSADANLASKKCIAIYDAGWHHGVVGIVASRLVEKYHRPVFIGQLDREEGIVKGSARGVSQIDLWEVLKDNEHLLTKWGGHKMAAGFATEADRADKLMKGLVATCNRMLAGKPLAGIVSIDFVAQPEVVNLDLARDLLKLAPFGMGNKKPRLCMTNLTCSDTRPLGKEQKHSRIMVKGDDQEFECVLWNSKGCVPEVGQTMDIAFTPEVNHFNNRDRLQLVLADWRSPGRIDLTREEAFEKLDSLNIPASEEKEEVKTQETMDFSPTASSEQSEDRKESKSLIESLSLPTRELKQPAKQSWKDLRGHEAPTDLLERAVSKLQDKLVIFCEAEQASAIKMLDRTDMKPSENLMLWQYPPSQEVFQELLARVAPANIYLIGHAPASFDEPRAFLKRLFGLVRFAINQRDGQISGEKLTALMASDKLSVALGLAVLRKANMVDWFAEEGMINLDLLGDTPGRLDDCQEFEQLSKRLSEIKSFRHWCRDSAIKDIQLALVKNGVLLQKDSVEEAAGVEAVNRKMSQDYGNADGKNRAPGVGAAPQ